MAQQLSSAPPTAASLRAPTLRRRLACLCYEGVLLFGVVFATALAYGLITQQRNAMQGREGLLLTALVAAPGLYLVWYWSQTGQTLPMQTWHMRLVTTEGARLSRLRALARYLASWVWFLPPLALWHFAGWHSGAALTAALAGWMAAYACLTRARADGQFWHDALCGTRLVDTRGPRA